jgi:hypothetical protein
MKYHILAIGISKHQSNSNNLYYADKDAKDFYNLFINNVPDMGYKKLLINSEATLAAIRTALGQELKTAIERDDAFFFFFSGHGATAEDQNGTSLAHYLVPFDGAMEDITSSSISVDYLKDALSKISRKVSFVFVDSCFSGSINSKSYPYMSKKALKNIKRFTDTQALGEGSVVFTASKADEEAIEDTENENGLFSSCLLREMQKGRAKDTYPVVEIFTPVTEAVIDRAGKLGRTQTPTVNAHFEGVVHLPVFKKPLKVSPQLVEIPQYPQLATTSFAPPEIELSNKAQQRLINNQIAMVLPTDPQMAFSQNLAYERFCWNLSKKIRADWEKVFDEVGSDVSKVPEAVAKLEAASFQLILLGCVTAIFGDDRKMQIYTDAIISILSWGENKAGLTALIAAPEVILVEVIYSIGVVCLANSNLKPFKTLLHRRVLNDTNNEGEPQPLFAYNHIFYCEALGGYASKVADHTREVIDTHAWMSELLPQIENKMDYQLQVNFLISMLLSQNNIRFWPDFGRFNGSRIRPLINKIKYDSPFQEQVASFIGIQVRDLQQVLFDKLREIISRGLGGGFFWMSIRPEILLTETLKS